MRIIPFRLSLATLFLLFSSLCIAQNAIKTGQFEIDPPTLRSFSFRWFVDGDDNGNASCQIKYRKVGTAQWHAAQPLLRVNRDIVDEASNEYVVGNLLAGSVLFAEPNTDYEVELTLTDPDGVSGTSVRTATVKTRAVPECPAPVNTFHLYPPGWQGPTSAPSYHKLQKALNVLRPGDLLLVYPGTHVGGGRIQASGTAAQPICIRGAGGGEAIIQIAPGVIGDQKGRYNFNVDGKDFIYFEDLTLSGGKRGISASGADNLVVRNCRIKDANNGIVNNRSDSENWWITDNEITGTNKGMGWFPRNPANGRPAGTGINLYGRGHVVAYNTISDFWDCLAVANFSPPPADPNHQTFAIDFYNNDLSNARDDAIEMDFASHNIRVWRNRLYNVHVGISLQPVYGGPGYVVRNEMYGITSKPYKLQRAPSGFYLFNNTSVNASLGLQANSNDWQNGTLRNNLFLGGDDKEALESGSIRKTTGLPDPRSTLDYNGWRQASGVRGFLDWNGQSYNDLAGYRTTGQGAHSILVDYDVFRDVQPPVRGTTYVPGEADLQLAALPNVAINAGVVLANITDDAIGPPDLGAHEYGQPMPHYGPRGNRAPVIDVEALADPAEVLLPDNVTTLTVRATDPDDGPDPLTYQWTTVDGPEAGIVTFSPNNSTDADAVTATFTNGIAGAYTFRVTVSDGIHSSSSDVAVALTAVGGNQPPVIDVQPTASPDPIAPGDNSTTLQVQAHDADTPPDALIYTWELVNGPGNVTFSPNASSAADSSNATFSGPGAYSLRVRISDGTNAPVVSNLVVVTVEEEGPGALDVNLVVRKYIPRDRTELNRPLLKAAIAGAERGARYNWTFSVNNGLYEETIDNRPARVIWRIPGNGLKAGQYEVTVSATAATGAAQGDTGTKRIQVSIEPRPIVFKLIPRKNIKKIGGEWYARENTVAQLLIGIVEGFHKGEHYSFEIDWGDGSVDSIERRAKAVVMRHRFGGASTKSLQMFGTVTPNGTGKTAVSESVDVHVVTADAFRRLAKK